MPFLDLVTAGRRVTRFPLAEGRTIIGRHPDCEIVFEAAAVSRQHAVVTCSADGAFIEDLQSRNGTQINGLPLTARRRLEDGDEIGVCGQRLVFAEANRRRQRTAARPVEASGTAHVILDGESSGVIVSQLELPQPGGEGLGQHVEAKLRAVLGLNRAIGASVAAEDVLPRLLDGLLEAFPQAERGFVLLVDPQSGRLAVRSQRVKDAASKSPLRISLSLVTMVAESRRAVLSADAAADTRFRDNESILDCRIRSVMCVPVVRSSGGVLGVVQVDSRDVSSGFTEADLEVLAGVAGQASQVIEQALAHDEGVAREHLARDLELAHRVQLCELRQATWPWSPTASAACRWAWPGREPVSRRARCRFRREPRWCCSPTGSARRWITSRSATASAGLRRLCGRAVPGRPMPAGGSSPTSPATPPVNPRATTSA